MKRKKKKTKRIANNYALLPETIELLRELKEIVFNDVITAGQVIDLAIRRYAQEKNVLGEIE